MTNTTEKVRSLFLVALMVGSVFGAGIAFSGSAAAVNSVTNPNLTNSTVEGGQDVSHTLTFTATNVTHNGNTDTVNITLPTVYDSSNVSISSVEASVNGTTPSTDSPPSSMTDANGDGTANTIQYTFAYQSSELNGQNTTDVNITAEFTLSHPNVDSEQMYAVDLSVQDNSGGMASSTVNNAITVQPASGTNTGGNTGSTATDADDTYVERPTTMDADGDGVYDIENISVDDGAILYQGQDIMFDSGTDDDNANSQYVLYRDRGTDTQDSVETILAANTNGGNFTFDTADLDTGADYYITNDGRNNPDFNFSLVAQSYSVEFDEDSIDDQGEDVATFLEVTADNRPGAEMPIRIDSEGLDDNDLEMIFDEWADNSNYRAVSAPEIDADDDDDTDDEEDGIIVIAQDEDEVTANFSDIDAGEYNFTTTVMDTEVDDDASITVNDVGDGEIGLDQSTVNTAQGDIATVTVTLSQASSGNLVIGDEEDSGYQANVGFSDEDDDGEVTIGFNTYTAGTSSEDTVFAVTDDEGDDDTVTFNAATGETNLTEIIATSDYGLAVRADGDYETTLSSPDTVGTLYVNERTTGNQTVWTAPSGADFNPDDEDGITSEDVATLVEEGTVTQDTTIAAVGSGADYNIHELSASGLGGVFEAIEVDNSNDPDLEGGDIDFADINGNGLNLTIEQTDESKAANAPAKVVDIQDSGTGAFDFVQDRENGNYYLIVDMSAVDLDRGEVVDDDDASTPEEQKNVQLADDDEFESEISIDANRLFEPQLDSDDESMNEIEEVDDDVTATFTTVDREVDFDQDPVQVGAASEQTITGTTSLAASSELTVRLKSTDDTQPRFVKTNDEVIAQPDGTWSVTFDFAEQSAGDTFDATVQKGSNPSTTVDGEVVEAVETTEQTTEQTAEQTTEQTAEQTTESETTESETTESETTASETTGESSPGFGIAVAVVALLAAALLAYRRD